MFAESRHRAWAVSLAVAAIFVPARAASPPPAYPLHTRITATVFWIGEPRGDGSSEDNALSAWDDAWRRHYGGLDDASYRRVYPYFPRFVPMENPFYVDLPYNDFTDAGDPRPDRAVVVPWARSSATELADAARADRPYSLMKNRWVQIRHASSGRTYTCYGQVEDAGPYIYDDAAYVFGAGIARPRSRLANGAGMDVSPALRDCLHFHGVNDDTNAVSWRFVDRPTVPKGPWLRVVTTRQIYWP